MHVNFLNILLGIHQRLDPRNSRSVQNKLYPHITNVFGGVLESACLYVLVSVCPSVCVSVCPSVCVGVSISPCVSVSICRCVHLSVCRCVHLCTKYYFLSKRWPGYKNTFSDSSSHVMTLPSIMHSGNT